DVHRRLAESAGVDAHGLESLEDEVDSGTADNPIGDRICGKCLDFARELASHECELARSDQVCRGERFDRFPYMPQRCISKHDLRYRDERLDRGSYVTGALRKIIVTEAITPAECISRSCRAAAGRRE